MPLMICWYWNPQTEKLGSCQADYAEALAAAAKAKALLSAAAAQIQLLDYFYYQPPLTVAALYENGFYRRADHVGATSLTEHQEQLHEWTENYSPTFAEQARAGC